VKACDRPQAFTANGFALAENLAVAVSDGREPSTVTKTYSTAPSAAKQKES